MTSARGSRTGDMAEGLFAPSHLIILVLIALVLFGPKRLPEIGRSLGQGLRGFREGVTGTQTPSDIHQAESEPERTLPTPEAER